MRRAQELAALVRDGEEFISARRQVVETLSRSQKKDQQRRAYEIPEKWSGLSMEETERLPQKQ
jgi:hypothetical protein